MSRALNKDELEKHIAYLETRLRNVQLHKPFAQAKVRARIQRALDHARAQLTFTLQRKRGYD